MQKLLDERDAAYVMLALIAISLVLAWVGVDHLPIPDKFKSALRNGYLLGGIALYVFTILIVKPL